MCGKHCCTIGSTRNFLDLTLSNQMHALQWLTCTMLSPWLPLILARNDPIHLGSFPGLYVSNPSPQSSLLILGPRTSHWIETASPACLWIAKWNRLHSNWVFYAFGKGTTFVLSHIYYYSFPTPKPQSIFGLHRQHRCQIVRLGPDWVACIFIYVLLHCLGGFNVFGAKSVFCQRRALSASLCHCVSTC